MAVCSFLGHLNIYDTEIDSMLQNAVESMVSENGKTDFLLFLCNDFYSRCFLTVLKAKARHPEEITITLVLPENDYRRHKTGGIPLCMVNRIIFPDPNDCESSGYRKVIQWLIRQSTHLISCLYTAFYEQENHILAYAQRIPELHILDIANADTAQAILERKPNMNDRERFIYERISGGGSPKEIAEALGISVGRLRQVFQHGCRILRESMRIRYHHLSAEKGKQQKSVCSIFSVGEVTYESLKTFDYLISFLLSRCDVTHFEISAEERHSGFMYVLGKHMKSDWILRDTETVRSRTDADTINQSDFCICNLSASPFAEEIREYILQTKHTVLVDMGQACSEIQQAFSCQV